MKKSTHIQTYVQPLERRKFLFRYTLMVCSIFHIFGSVSWAQTNFEDWKRAQVNVGQAQKNAFLTWRTEQDRQFAEHLRQEWQDFQVFQGKVRDANPKPRQLPIAQPPDRPDLPAPTVVPLAQSPKPSIVPDSVPLPVVVPPMEPPAIKPSETYVTLEFGGHKLNIPIDPKWKNLRAKSFSADGIADYWERVSNTSVQPTLNAVEQLRTQWNLDDWAHVNLWQTVVRATASSRTEQDLLLWFLLVKRGLDVRLGYSGQQVYLFASVKQPVYAVPFVQLEGRTYYAILNSADSLKTFHTYPSNGPVSLKPLSLVAASTGFTQPKIIEKTVSFSFRDQPVQISYQYDSQLVQFLSTYPQFDFELYFVTQPDQFSRSSLLKALGERTRGMSQVDVVNFLLTFVQTAFAYKNDEEQFGREKYFFVEEVLHYPYSDCEDRSVLFAWLVRELLKINTVGLHFPGHVTTAVLLSDPPQPNWATVDWQNKKYVIADPTYINASLGMAMPSYAGKKPIRVIP